MGRPARNQPTLAQRPDGTLYSSHRQAVPKGDPPGPPTPAAVELHMKQAKREAARQRRPGNTTPTETP